MAGIKNWAIRPHIKDFRQPDEKYPKGVEARYVVLDYLILCSNLRLRNFYGVDRIMEDCGFNSSAVVADALGWLFERGALYNVPPEYRVGKEAKLSKNKYVFQLTGVICLRDQWIPYLLLQSDELAEMVEEWAIVGYQLPVDSGILLSDYKPSQSEVLVGSKASQSEPSQSEPSQSEGEGIPPVLEGIPPNSQGNKAPETSSGSITTSGLTPEQVRQMAANSQAVSSSESNTWTPRKEGFATHPMIVELEKAADRELTAEEIKMLSATYQKRYEDSTTTHRSVMEMYDRAPGYSTFFTFRVTVHKHIGGEFINNVKNLISDLRNVSREESGWQAWKIKNPYITMRNASAEPAEAEYEIMSDEEAKRLGIQ